MDPKLEALRDLALNVSDATRKVREAEEALAEHVAKNASELVARRVVSVKVRWGELHKQMTEAHMKGAVAVAKR